MSDKTVLMSYRAFGYPLSGRNERAGTLRRIGALLCGVVLCVGLVGILLLFVMPVLFGGGGMSILHAGQSALHSPIAPTVTLSPTVPAAPVGVVTAQSVSVRAQPEPNSGRAGRLLRNQTFTIIGQGRSCSWLQIVTNDGVTGWVLANRKSLKWDVDCATLPRGTFRPATGTRQGGFPNGGAGLLKIENEDAKDIVVVLITRDWRHMQVSYVRGDEEHIADAIPNGIYEVYITTGAAWNGEKFTQDVTHEKFEDLFEYDSTRGKYGWRITVDAETEGNAVTLLVEEEDFPPVLYE